MDHGKIVAMDRPAALVDSLLSRGFQKDRTENLANLEDVFLDLTGRALRDE
jgi:ABC-2 type transport system ATP-binding protein